MPVEANPFLGWRGIGCCLAHPNFTVQFSPMVRVAAEYP